MGTDKINANFAFISKLHKVRNDLSLFDMLNEILKIVMEEDKKTHKEPSGYLLGKRRRNKLSFILNDLGAMSFSTFSDMKINPNHRPSYKTMISICAVLGLDIITATRLLSKAGYAFRPGESQVENAYIYVIDLLQYRRHNIEDANEILYSLGIDEKHYLGTLDRKKDFIKGKS